MNVFLSPKDCYTVFSKVEDEINFPIHIHSDYELTFIENAKGTKRVVGDSVEEIDDVELCLITGSNLSHGYLGNKKNGKNISEIIIHFHNDLLNESLLMKNQFKTIKKLFDKAMFGISFPLSTIEKVRYRLNKLTNPKDRFHSVLSLFSILYDLSISPDIHILSSPTFGKQNNEDAYHNNHRIEIVYNFMLENFDKKIQLADVASKANMSEIAFSRFFKRYAGKNFIEILHDIRLGHASQMLVDTTYSISEICFSCGFNNLSNFNHIFKKEKNCSPSEFRKNYKELHILDID